MKYAIRVSPDERVNLASIDTGHDHKAEEDEGRAKFAELGPKLAELQEELYAARVHSVLIVLQGMDTSGKDGTVRHVFDHVNPQGCRVEAFKVPTEEEVAHDFLWRVHKVTPEKGMIAVFNRSHYEDVLVVRVHKLIPDSVWKSRYAQINRFEEFLTENNTLIFKFFLHISKDEQKERLLAREQDVAKAWKLSAGDWHERELWDKYQEAYEDALSHCSTSHAPWHIIPADSKWFRDLTVRQALVDGLSKKRDEWKKTLQEMSAARLKELEGVKR